MNNNTRLPSLAATAAPPNDRENVLSAYARRSQDRPVTVLHYPLVEVVLLCGTTLSYNVFSTVDEIYDLAWQRLCYLQGPAWDTNSFRVNVVFQNRILLNRCVGLCEYGIRDGDTICVYVTGNLLGGASNSGMYYKGEYYPGVEDTWCARKKARQRKLDTFTHRSHEYVTERLNKVTVRKEKARVEKALDSHEEIRVELQSAAEYMDVANAFLQTMNDKFDTDFLRLMEDLIIFVVQLSRARDKTDLSLAILCFIRGRTSRSLIEEAASNLHTLVDALYPTGPVVQASLEENVTSFRDVLGKWDELKDTSMGKKYLKLMRYLAAYGIFTKIGVPATMANLRRAEELGGGINHADFLFNVVDTLSFTLQRSLMFMRTGEWSVFLHGPKTYAEWYDKCLDIKRKAYSLGNLEAQGTDYFAFVASLKECIEEGHAIVKFAARDLKTEIRAAKMMLHEILMIEATVLTKKSAQQERRAPFAVLVHGDSSVAKSMFQKMLFYYYGKVMNLPTASEYRFVRNPADKFWSGFSSQVWCIQLDDIGYLNPAKASEDPSLTELIAIVNNVPLVPNQADLADKGKTPVRARCVLASSNTDDLNASAYFSCPLAVQRRLPWVITICPRPEFARSDAPGMIDPTKLDKLDGDWPDFWHIKVSKVIPGGKANKQSLAVLEQVKMFNNTQAFLDWFGPVCKDFDAIQGKAMGDDEIMANLDVCILCNKTKKRCSCVQSQSIFPENEQWGSDFSESLVTPTGVTVKKNYMYNDGTYMCHTMRVQEGMILSQHVSPVNFVRPATRPIVQAETEVAYADIMNEVIRRQRERETGTAWCVAASMNAFLGFYIKYKLVRRFTGWILSFSLVSSLARSFVLNYVPPMKLARSFFSFLGLMYERSYLSRKWLQFVVGFGMVVAGWKTYKRVTGYEIQGGVVSVPNEHFRKTERENVWKRDDYQTTSFDVNPMSWNWATLPTEQVISKIRKNTARIVVSDGKRKMPGNAFCVGGHLWVTNSHIMLDSDDPVKVELMFEPKADGTSRNVEFMLQRNDVYREEGNDIAYFEVLAVDARPDLTALVARSDLEGVLDCKYIGLDRDCRPREIDVTCAQRTMEMCVQFDRLMSYWRGYVERDTNVGDCGTPLVSMKPHVTILGFHQMGGSNKIAFAVKMSQSSLGRARQYFARPIIQSGAPVISSELVKKEIGPLHYKSPLRWLTQGSLVVFGSFVGYRIKSRSKVASTMCGDYIRKIRGWHIPFGAPDLKDWRPWHHALKDVVEQKNVLKSDVLKKAVDGYVQDVCAGLDDEAKHNLRILTDHAAVNGIAGVSYIDKMNFNSSMGEPFCTSKKSYLVASPTEELPNAKMFKPEIMERAAKIEELYRNGVRACPIFSGQAKDEARNEAKIAAGKIRIFTGAPADWSLVVRKYLLTFVKVVQENRLLFEAAPGCVTQSLEWEQFRDYLVAHGVDQIVAGDYGKFDKKMTAQVILAAFDAIIAILEYAGWGPEDLLVIYGIAEDTAYSYVNMNGDLVMLYGSNPSGHPLTVIINSIVNALYMRYCFIELNPEQSCTLFKRFVNLLTYGDDNVMGVSKSIPWFNHTSIVRVLASIGVEYTMADKESESVPYICIDDVSFLKRSWRWDEDIGAYVCVLEEMSIWKMLCLCIPSKTVSPSVQMLDEMNSAVREYFWYGKERFEKEKKFLEDVISEFHLETHAFYKPLPEWEDLKSAFWRASEGMTTVRLGVVGGHPA